MAIVYAKPGEPTDQIIHRFKQKMMDDDILSELKEREFYKKPSKIKQDKIRGLRKKIKEQNHVKRKYHV